MRIGLVPCIQCEAEKAEHQYWVKGFELRDDLTFDVECPSGHRTRLIYEAQKFEILFDMGASALLDGYSREAISTFASAQERFHEFCIRVFLIGSGATKEAFNASWKMVSKQSERQFGAYCFLHLHYFKAPPPYNQKMVEFRNDVIHKGLIPSLEDATKYAEYVYDYIIKAVLAMRGRLNDHINNVCRDGLEELKFSIPKGVMTRSAKVLTMIGLSKPQEKFGKKSFREALAIHKEDHKLELQNRIEDMEEQMEEEEEED